MNRVFWNAGASSCVLLAPYVVLYGLYEALKNTQILPALLGVTFAAYMVRISKSDSPKTAMVTGWISTILLVALSQCALSLGLIPRNQDLFILVIVGLCVFLIVGTWPKK